MKNKYIPLVILIFIGILFSYKSLFFLKIPFPGDLLIAESAPWKYESYLGYNPGSYPHKAQYADVIRQIIPWRFLAIDQIKKGIIPLWNPYNFSGSPLLANNQSSALYPFNIFFIVSPFVIGWTIYILSQSFLMLIFTYLYARELKISKTGSILSSIVFSCSLFVSVFFEYGIFGHTILWLPMILWCIEKYSKKRSIRYYILLCLGILASILAGHLQIALGVLGFTVFYICVKFWSKPWVMIKVLSGIAVGIGMGFVQLLPTVELILSSSRVSHETENYLRNILTQVWQLIVVFSPDAFGNPVSRNYLLTDSYPGNALFVGSATIIFVVYGILRSWNFYVKLYIFTAIGMVIFVTNNPISQLIFLLKIPLFSTSSPSNLMFLISFSLAVIAGFGYQAIEKKPDKKILTSIGITFLLFLVTVGLLYIFKSPFFQKQILFNGVLLIFASVLIGASVYFKKGIILIALVALIVGELFYYFIKFNPFVSSKLFYPETEIINQIKNTKNYSRAWGYGSANIDSNYSSLLGFYSPEGYDPLYPSWYGELVSRSENGSIKKDQFNRRSDAVIFPGSGEKDLRDNTNRTAVLNELNVEYILDRVENGSTEYTYPSDHFQPIYDNEGWKIFHNKNASPRALFTSEFCEKEGEIFTNTHIAKICRSGEDSSGIVGADIISYTPNKVVVEFYASASGILVVSDTFYPGWKAVDNGSRAEIYKTNHAFRGIKIENHGNHTVEFEYKPASFSFGIIISIMSTVLLVCIGMINKNERNK